ncbi:hypothetical protein [Phormidium sp. CCY1219]|nr:hypothetical protein [Phormidium sp. CCY1219]MEB3831313.1 hypothetical protein [Phormidium sp. CCY1219]
MRNAEWEAMKDLDLEQEVLQARSLLTQKSVVRIVASQFLHIGGQS